jgi:hypothetical protein
VTGVAPGEKLYIEDYVYIVSDNAGTPIAFTSQLTETVYIPVVIGGSTNTEVNMQILRTPYNIENGAFAQAQDNYSVPVG